MRRWLDIKDSVDRRQDSSNDPWISGSEDNSGVSERNVELPTESLQGPLCSGSSASRAKGMAAGHSVAEVGCGKVGRFPLIMPFSTLCANVLALETRLQRAVSDYPSSS